MPKTQDRNSLDDFLVPVQLVIPVGANPQTDLDVVQFQFVFGGLPKEREPTSDGWLTGFWLTQSPGPLLAGILVGPGGTIELPVGRWAVWMKVIDNPTVPVKPVDTLTIT